MTARFESKILSRGDCVAAVAAGRYARPLVFTNGVFDILHRGHATYLDQAAQLGGTLIVAVNTDESVRRLGKGAERPLNRMEDRAALLAALGCVAVVTSFHEDTPEVLIGQLKPDLIVRAATTTWKHCPRPRWSRAGAAARWRSRSSSSVPRRRW